MAIECLKASHFVITVLGMGTNNKNLVRFIFFEWLFITNCSRLISIPNQNKKTITTTIFFNSSRFSGSQSFIHRQHYIIFTQGDAHKYFYRDKCLEKEILKNGKKERHYYYLRSMSTKSSICLIVSWELYVMRMI